MVKGRETGAQLVGRPPRSRQACLNSLSRSRDRSVNQLEVRRPLAKATIDGSHGHTSGHNGHGHTSDHNSPGHSGGLRSSPGLYSGRR